MIIISCDKPRVIGDLFRRESGDLHSLVVNEPQRDGADRAEQNPIADRRFQKFKDQFENLFDDLFASLTCDHGVITFSVQTGDHRKSPFLS